MKTQDMILLGGALAAGYYFFVFKPAQGIAQAGAAGAGAVNAIGSGASDVFGGLFAGLGNLFSGLLPGAAATTVIVQPQPWQGAAPGSTSQVNLAQIEAANRLKLQLQTMAQGTTTPGGAKTYTPQAASILQAFNYPGAAQAVALSTVPVAVRDAAYVAGRVVGNISTGGVAYKVVATGNGKETVRVKA